MGATYGELLRDPRWQKCRLRVLERDGFACTECHDGKSELHVHHRYYAKGKAPWEYEDGALVTVCDTCHERAEEARKSLIRTGGLLALGQTMQVVGFAEGVAAMEKWPIESQVVTFKGPFHLYGLCKAINVDLPTSEAELAPIVALFKETGTTTVGAIWAKARAQ